MKASIEDPKTRIKNLSKEIDDLRLAYNTHDNPRVSDAVYDSLVRELRDLEAQYPEYADPNSPIHRVGGEPLSKFVKVTHSKRMLSLNDAFSHEEVIKWSERMQKLLPNADLEYFCEIKMDGLAVSLIYENGKLIRGATRGDGTIGEDITENIKMVNSISLILKSPYPKRIEVRGEAVMSRKVFDELNKKNAKLGLQLLANTRNAAAGSLRQLDPKLARERNLDFFAYDIAEISDENNLKINKHSDKHDLMRKLGFVLDKHELISNDMSKIFDFISKFEKIRDKYNYGTDGLVVCVNDLSMQETLGVVGKAPRFAIAYKYPAEKATTVVRDITFSVGRTGALTPLAHFDPTLVAGSVISKSTLHNMDQIERLDIRVGDTVVIQKAGDVIPEVVEVLKNLRPKNSKIVKIPNKCPICSGDVENKSGATNNSVAFYCVNQNCPAKNKRAMQHFVSVFEIYEIGPKILDRLQEEGLITDSADLFSLEESDLSGLERFGEKSAKNIIESINSKKKIPLWRFIYSLGILHVGEQTAKDLANHFQTFEKILKVNKEEVNSIENIGPVVSSSFYDFIHNKSNIKFIEKLITNGVVVEKAEKIKNAKFTGMTFVLTGTLATMSRDIAKEKINKLGGKVAGSVSVKTTYVVAGTDSGTKLATAQKLGVKILTESEFLKLL